MLDSRFHLDPVAVQFELAKAWEREMGLRIRKGDERVRDGLRLVRAERIGRRRFFQLFWVRRFLFRVAPRWAARIALF